MEIDVPKTINLLEKHVYWIQYKKYSDPIPAKESIRGSDASLTKCSHAFSAVAIKTLVDLVM